MVASQAMPVSEQGTLGVSQFRAALSGVFLGALALRLLSTLTVDRTVWGEEPAYLWLASNLLQGKGFTYYSGLPETILAPGYPLLVGLVHLFSGDLIFSSNFWYVVAGTGALLPLFLLGREIYGDQVALLASLLLALAPATTAGALFAGTLTEPPYIFFLLSGLYFSYQMFRRDLWRDSLLSGVCFSAAYLIRQEGHLYFFLFLVLALTRLLRVSTLDWGKAGRHLLLYVAGFLIFALPYVLYLHSTSGKWSLVGRSRQAYVLARALAQNDPARHDLETWGLNPGGREVRLFSPDPDEMPLLTLFFENPGDFIEDFFANIGISLQILARNEFLGPLFIALAFLGLVGTPWNRSRARAEIFLFLSLLPLVGFALFHVTERYLYSAIPIFLLWAARGLEHLNRWIHRSCDSIWQFHQGRRIESSVKFIGMALLIGFLLSMNYRIYRNPYPPHIYELKTVARWIEQNTPASSVIVSRQPEIAFHANRTWVCFPHAPFPESVAYAKRHGGDYLVVELDVVSKLRPHLIPLLKENRIPAGLREIQTIEIPPNKSYRIFQIMD